MGLVSLILGGSWWMTGCRQAPHNSSESAETIDAIRRNLGSPLEAARIIAVRKLGRSQLPDRRELLIAALLNDTPHVQVEAIAGLSQGFDRETAPVLIRALDSPLDNVQMAAARSLFILAGQATEELLEALSSAHSPQVRSWCAAVLGERRIAAAAPLLQTMMFDSQERVAIAAAQALGKLGDEGVAVLASQFPMLQPRVRSYVAMILATHGRLGILLDASSQGDEATVAACLEGLAANPLPESVAAIKQCLGSSAVAIRHAAVLAAGKINDPECNNILAAIAEHDPNDIIRLLAETTLRSASQPIVAETPTRLPAELQQFMNRLESIVPPSPSPESEHD